MAGSMVYRLRVGDESQPHMRQFREAMGAAQARRDNESSESTGASISAVSAPFEPFWSVPRASPRRNSRKANSSSPFSSASIPPSRSSAEWKAPKGGRPM